MYDELVKSIHCCFGDDSIQTDCENCMMKDKREEHNYVGCCDALGLAAADAIEELQKAVPKSGVWREEEGGYDDVYYECSVCGAGICTIEGDPVDNAWSYCPECGAKMTGVERLPELTKEEIK